MKLVVIGAVAAGTSAAAKARRNDDFAEITIYDKGVDISYSGCGLPYYIGDEIKDIEELRPRDSKFFKEKYNIDVKTNHEVKGIDKDKKTIEVENVVTGEIFTDTYDKLVIATGASPFVPKIKGINNENVFFLRNVQNAIRMKKYILKNNPKNVIIAGTGFIGFEMLENLLNYNMNVTIVEIGDKISPNLDYDMAKYLENLLIKRNIKIIKSNSITNIEETKVILKDKREIKAEIVVMATGVRPNTKLAKEAGILLGEKGAIKVNNQMLTNVKDIYAAGDCIETFSTLTGDAVYHPLGSTANKTGRIAGDALTGGDLTYKGNLSTGIFKLFDLTVASTGLSEKEALLKGYDIEVVHNIKPDKPKYFKGEEMLIKAIADKKSKRLLGVQIVGKDGVDKRIDVFVTLITYKATVDELFHLDLAYAPPFSTTKDPVHYTGMILDNAMNRGRKVITSEKIRASKGKIQIIDARSNADYNKKGHVKSSKNIPLKELRGRLEELDKSKETVTYCNKGVTGNAAQNVLINHGFKKVYNLSGGNKFYKGTEQK